MSTLVDTNILVRHLTGDPAGLAARATRFLTDASELIVTDLVLAETVYVLESYYEVPRGQIADAIRSLLAFQSVVTADPQMLSRAMDVYETERLDFAEAYLVACAETRGITRVVSFDRSIDQLDSMERIELPR